MTKVRRQSGTFSSIRSRHRRRTISCVVMYRDLLTRALGKEEGWHRSGDLLLADLVETRARLHATGKATPVAEALARGALLRRRAHPTLRLTRCPGHTGVVREPRARTGPAGGRAAASRHLAAHTTTPRRVAFPRCTFSRPCDNVLNGVSRPHGRGRGDLACQQAGWGRRRVVRHLSIRLRSFRLPARRCWGAGNTDPADRCPVRPQNKGTEPVFTWRKSGPWATQAMAVAARSRRSPRSRRP